MLPLDSRHGVTAIIPCNDLRATEAFYAMLGFRPRDTDSGAHADYRLLSDGRGGDLHLTRAVEGWLVPGRNPFGIYLYTPEVDDLARRMGERIIEQEKAPVHKPWGMYEFAVSDPDDTLVRIGWPSHLVRG